MRSTILHFIYIILHNLYKATYSKSLIFSKYCSPPKKLGRALKKSKRPKDDRKVRSIVHYNLYYYFLIGNRRKTQARNCNQPPQLSLVLRLIHKGFNPVNKRQCFAVVDSKPTDVIVSLYLLSIGNFKVRQMVSMGRI